MNTVQHVSLLGSRDVAASRLKSKLSYPAGAATATWGLLLRGALGYRL